MSSTSNDKYRRYMGVDMLWPPDCPDDVLEQVVNEV